MTDAKADALHTMLPSLKDETALLEGNAEKDTDALKDRCIVMKKLATKMEAQGRKWKLGDYCKVLMLVAIFVTLVVLREGLPSHCLASQQQHMTTHPRAKMAHTVQRTAHHSNYNLASDYAKLHSHILELPPGHPDKRFLILKCGEGELCGGFGSHMLGVSGALLIAIVTKRALLLELNNTFPLQDFVEPVSFDWRYSRYASQLANLSVRTNNMVDRHPPPFFYTEDLDKKYPEQVARFSGLNNPHFLTVMRENPYYRQMFTRYKLNEYVADDQMFEEPKWNMIRRSYGHQRLHGLLLRMLFKPNAQVVNEIDRIRSSVGNRFLIGMHVRMGGHFVEGFKDNPRLNEDAVAKFLQCASNVARMAATDILAIPSMNTGGTANGGNGTVGGATFDENRTASDGNQTEDDSNRNLAWFVASDSNHALEMLRGHAEDIGIPMITFEGGRRVHTDPRHETRVVAGNDYLQVFVDWFMLAQCDFLVLTRSTFGMAAKNFGETPWQLMNVKGTETDMADDYQLCFPDDR